MKIKLTILALIISSFMFSQSLEIGFNMGTGATYMVENADDNVNINYKTPASISSEIKFTPANSSFGIVMRYQYTGTTATGTKWFDASYTDFKARVSDNTFFLMLEYLKKNQKKFNFGANFGIGYTKQNINFENESYNTITNEFPSINIGGIVAYRLNNKLTLKLTPSFQFFDPIDALSNNSLQFAREDIHFLTMFGISYQLN